MVVVGNQHVVVVVAVVDIASLSRDLWAEAAGSPPKIKISSSSQFPILIIVGVTIIYWHHYLRHLILSFPNIQRSTMGVHPDIT